jgi:hypothetical protein
MKGPMVGLESIAKFPHALYESQLQRLHEGILFQPTSSLKGWAVLVVKKNSTVRLLTESDMNEKSRSQ